MTRDVRLNGGVRIKGSSEKIHCYFDWFSSLGPPFMLRARFTFQSALEISLLSCASYHIVRTVDLQWTRMNMSHVGGLIWSTSAVAHIHQSLIQSPLISAFFFYWYYSEFCSSSELVLPSTIRTPRLSTIPTKFSFQTIVFLDRNLSRISFEFHRTLGANLIHPLGPHESLGG